MNVLKLKSTTPLTITSKELSLKLLKQEQENLCSHYYLLGGTLFGNFVVSLTCSFVLAKFTFDLLGWSYLFSMIVICSFLMSYLVPASKSKYKQLLEVEKQINDIQLHRHEDVDKKIAA